MVWILGYPLPLSMHSWARKTLTSMDFHVLFLEGAALWDFCYSFSWLWWHHSKSTTRCPLPICTKTQLWHQTQVSWASTIDITGLFTSCPCYHLAVPMVITLTSSRSGFCFWVLKVQAFRIPLLLHKARVTNKVVNIPAHLDSHITGPSCNRWSSTNWTG